MPRSVKRASCACKPSARSASDQRLEKPSAGALLRFSCLTNFCLTNFPMHKHHQSRSSCYYLGMCVIAQGVDPDGRVQPEICGLLINERKFFTNGYRHRA